MFVAFENNHVSEFTSIVVETMHDIKEQQRAVWPKLESLLSAIREANIAQTRTLATMEAVIHGREEEMRVVTRLQDLIALRTGTMLPTMLHDTVEALAAGRSYVPLEYPSAKEKIGTLAGNCLHDDVKKLLLTNPWYLILYIGSLHN